MPDLVGGAERMMYAAKSYSLRDDYTNIESEVALTDGIARIAKDYLHVYNRSLQSLAEELGPADIEKKRTFWQEIAVRRERAADSGLVEPEPALVSPLERIDLSECRRSGLDVVAEYLSKCPNLQAVDLPFMNNAGLEHLAKCKNLQSICTCLVMSEPECLYGGPE